MDVGTPKRPKPGSAWVLGETMDIQLSPEAMAILISNMTVLVTDPAMESCQILGGDF